MRREQGPQGYKWVFLFPTFSYERLDGEGPKIEAVQKQTAFGKDKSNPLIVDSLLKTIRLSIHLVVYNEELAIPEQTATEGKLKENQGCRVDTDQVHQNGDLKNRSVWIHPPGLQDCSNQCFIIVALELSKGTNPLQAKEQDTPPPTITAMKIPIIKKGEYDIWSMRMRQYICHTDHNLWDVIVNGDLEEEPAPTRETYAPPAPKTTKQLAAKRN
ncbi:hypothetical protein Tco_1369635 [Tanacetum coccineum]